MSTETLSHSIKRTSDNRTSSYIIGTIRDPTKLCEYCGWDIEEQDLEILSFFHCDCWIEKMGYCILCQKIFGNRLIHLGKKISIAIWR